MRARVNDIYGEGAFHTEKLWREVLHTFAGNTYYAPESLSISESS